ncbi:MAG: triose-phosphate isomerase [Betaproteobacteria bacterium]|jgi:triosephosphate isomerase (TIM)|nr:triose-phosphate isomerase [Betaproteobacteria bacterium]
MARRWVVGNWKMVRAQPTVPEWLQSAAQQPTRAGVDVSVAVPAPYVFLAQQLLQGSSLVWGAQDVSWDEEGAHTGEVSATMLAESGCSIVLVGHSERRLRFGETDAQVTAKASRARAAGIRPIVCVGELAAERRAGKAESVVGAQIEALLVGLHGDLSGISIAYEPIWAIGTGVAAAPEEAAAMHGFIRHQLGGSATSTPLLYGGSVSAENAAQLMSLPDIDGVLVGGGSLRTESFFAICDAAARCVGV